MAQPEARLCTDNHKPKNRPFCGALLRQYRQPCAADADCCGHLLERDAPASIIHGMEELEEVGGLGVVLAVLAQARAKGGQQRDPPVVEVRDGKIGECAAVHECDFHPALEWTLHHSGALDLTLVHADCLPGGSQSQTAKI